MRNLAGILNATSNFCDELRVCGIPAVESLSPDGETRCSVDGLLTLPGGFVLRVVRRWAYAAVTITPPLPVAVAVEIADLPAEGYAGGLFGDHLLRFSSRGVEGWHCDSTEALTMLASALHEAIVAHGLTSDGAAAEHRTIFTNEWIAECEQHCGGDDHFGKMLRCDLHTNLSLDGADPRVIALRAKYTGAS